MLCDLSIRNVAIIDRLKLSFGPGLNVLTGETGAGKSILIGALQLLLGERARNDLIRTGEEEAAVEAVFHPVPTALRAALEEQGLPVEDDLIIRRTLSATGRSRLLVNGAATPLASWQQIAPRLIALFGQHDHQLLQQRDNHLRLIDEVASIAAPKTAYLEVWERWSDVQERLQRLQLSERDRQQRLDLLRFQQEELTAADLQLEEEPQLERERQVLLHAEKLAATAEAAYQALYADDGSAVERAGQMAAELQRLEAVDAAVGELGTELADLGFRLDDLAQRLRHYAQGLEHDPGRLDEVEQRLALLQRLKRKYGCDVAGLIGLCASARQELEELETADARLDGLRQEQERCARALHQAAADLSNARRAAAAALCQGISRELSDLAMGTSRIHVEWTVTDPGPAGAEIAEFYLAANPGEAPRPLARTASGGELSRIMLALRRALPGAGLAEVTIFDEVDAGIGGATATAVGAKLKGVADSGQVLCITHLPQVAAFADGHYRVDKVVADGRTTTQVAVLTDEERVEEMARMLGGARVTDQTRAHAREMIRAHARELA